ncbi:MAG: hypothetical protein JWM00_527 [Candidatus Saccharibacteria bacterium]|nr:hypothetical protein [Candidatus Saccharibacteria bacterium]
MLSLTLPADKHFLSLIKPPVYKWVVLLYNFDMSIEAIPSGYDRVYNPLDQVDHRMVAMSAGVRILEGGHTPRNMQYLFVLQQQLGIGLVNKLFEFGKFVEPVEYREGVLTFDPELQRAKTFMSGMIIALTTLDSMSQELNIEKDEWRNVWLARLQFIRSVSEDALKNIDEKAACEAKGAAVIEIGARELACVEQPYIELLDRIDDTHPALAMFGNVFRASFGYVFSAGREAIKDILLERDLHNSVQTPQELDADLKILVESYHHPDKQ